MAQKQIAPTTQMAWAMMAKSERYKELAALAA
jgi:hypothetical protein